MSIREFEADPEQVEEWVQLNGARIQADILCGKASY